MKIMMRRDVLVEVDKTRLGEIWDKPLKKWEVYGVEKIDSKGKTADLMLYDEDIFMNVPADSFEIV